MPKSKRKKRRPNASKSIDRASSGMLPAVTPRRPRADRHQLVALTLASLVAGLLAVINCDRITHASQITIAGSSRHGWPWVYLNRDLAETPTLFISGRTYSWPWPPVKDEIREFNYQNLIFDLLVAAVITVAVYWLVKTIVYRYDRWRYGSEGVP